MDLDKLKASVNDNKVIKAYFANKKFTDQHYVSWNEFIHIFGDEPDMFPVRKLNRDIAGVHLDMHNTAFYSQWGVKYYPLVAQNLQTLLTRRNMYFSANVLWVFGINTLFLRPSYFELYNLPLINIKKFFDYGLLKKDIVQTRGKYIKNYINVLNNRRYNPNLKFLKEKMNSPVAKYQKYLVNQKAGKKFFSEQAKDEHDLEVSIVRKNYLKNSPTSLVFLKKFASDIRTTGGLAKTGKRMSGIFHNARDSAKFFISNFDAYKSQLRSLPNPEFMRRMEQAKAFHKQTGQKRILNDTAQVKRRFYQLSQALEEVVPSQAVAKDGFYDGVMNFVVGSKENIVDLMKLRYYARDYVDLGQIGFVFFLPVKINRLRVVVGNYHRFKKAKTGWQKTLNGAKK